MFQLVFNDPKQTTDILLSYMRIGSFHKLWNKKSVGATNHSTLMQCFSFLLSVLTQILELRDYVQAGKVTA
jgi:hypothetical protein